jgi:hypothetical protein
MSHTNFTLLSMEFANVDATIGTTGNYVLAAVFAQIEDGRRS